VRAVGADGRVVVGRVEREDRLWRGMKDRYAVVIPERGGGEYRFRGGTYRQGPGLLRLVMPGEMYRELRRDGPATYDVVLIEPEAVGQEVVFTDPQLDARDPRAASLLALRDAALAGEGVDGALAVAAAALVELGTRPTSLREPAKVRRACAYLRERLDERVTLDDLSAHVRLDRFALIRAFHAEIGAPPYELLTHLRVHRACELLRGGMSAAAVAAAVGYFDQSQLHRHFRRLTGTTPGRYAAARGTRLRASTTAVSRSTRSAS
jgi:AraC-like DNA-binding protein